jgi:hypothetical protein
MLGVGLESAISVGMPVEDGCLRYKQAQIYGLDVSAFVSTANPVSSIVMSF